MREIKFRVFDTQGDEYIEYWCGNSVYTLNEIFENKRFIFEQFIVHEDEQDIYEGDIIEVWKHGNLMRTFTADDIRIFIRQYNKCEHGSIFKVVGTVNEGVTNETTTK